VNMLDDADSREEDRTETKHELIETQARRETDRTPLSTECDTAAPAIVPLSTEVFDPKRQGDAAGQWPSQRFKKVSHLGSGGFANVYKVWDTVLEVHRAMKIARTDGHAISRANSNMFVAEARKLIQVEHSGIVKVVDVQANDGGTPFIVSEFVPGGSLEAELKKGPLPVERATQIMEQVAEAIAYAHRKGIIHRDLKPANILFNDEGHPVVVDFGLAMGDEDFARGPGLCGTWMYMSPEQVRGEADVVDGRSDVYSLGVVLYEMLAGKPPWRSRELHPLKEEILRREAPPLRQHNPAIPEEVERIVSKAMSKSPAARYSTAADFARELRESLDKPPVPPTRFWVVVASVAALIVMILALVGFGAYWFWPSEPASEGPPSGHGIPIPPVVENELGALDPDLEVLYQSPNEEGTWHVLANEDLPLRNGDKVQFHVKLSKPAYVYIFWGEPGKPPQELFPHEPPGPGEPKAGSDRSSIELAPQTEVWSPKDYGGDEAKWWNVTDAGQPQLALVGIRTTPLADEELARFKSTPIDFERELPRGRWMAEFELPDQPDHEHGIPRDRGVSLVMSSKTVLGDRLSDLRVFDACHGWIFATRGDE